MSKTGAKTPPRKTAKALQSKPSPSVSRQVDPAPEPDSEGDEICQMTIRLRQSLKEAIEEEARARNLTRQALILFALQELGLPVTDSDLEDGRTSDARMKRGQDGGNAGKEKRRYAPDSARQSSGPHKPGTCRDELDGAIELLQRLGHQSSHGAGTPTVIVINAGCQCS